jgi:prepilin-type N-terminal cleavage/methylation domain-containing protein
VYSLQGIPFYPNSKERCMQSRIHKNNRKGFTLVEVIVVAVIVAVLALVGIQLYQGYVTESNRNMAENLAGSAAQFLMTIENTNGATSADALGDLAPGGRWSVPLAGGNNVAVFGCPATATISITPPTVSATVNNISSTGTYNYR